MSRNLYQEADELERAGRFDEAVERWREASVVTPDAYTLARLGRLYLRHGQVETGESLLREVITRFPNVAGAYFYLGNHYMAQGKLADAKVLLEHSVDLEEWAPALISLGSLYWRLRDTEAARRVLRRATVADPEDSEAWSNLAMTYAREDDDRARELFERAVALDAENVFAWQELGSLCWHHGHFETAEGHVRRALALDDHSAWAHDYLGLILEATHRIHEAAQEFRRATEIWPDVPLFHCQLGDVLVQLGRYVEAEREYTCALAYDVNSFVANLGMGQRRLAQGRYAEARRYLERARALKPSDHRVQEALSSLPPE